MLVNIYHDSRAEHRKLLVAGIAFLTVIVLLVSLSIAIYQKTFASVTMVTIKADRAGLQLAKYGDVRIHGVLVGQVRTISQDGHKASIQVAIKPSAAKNIPENISVQILPTTLFGQKFISFIDPEQPSGRPLHDGEVIPSSRVETNVELSQILADLFPLLRTVRPADLNTTLYAISHALVGNGDKIGRTLDDLDQYLTAINAHLPTVRRDLVLLAKVSKTYSIAAPDLLRLLRNATVTAQTIADKQEALPAFIHDVTGLAKTSTRVLTTNEKGIIRLSELSQPITGLLDTYSPEYPCLLKGLDRYTGRLAEIFAGNRVRQTMSFGAKQRRAYNSSDKPVYGEVGHGPWCLGLPYPKVPAGYHPLKDGSDLDNPNGK
jgi:phospholipid/cholesterol/gamma-HCH transport system substrate-binding protein